MPTPLTLVALVTIAFSFQSAAGQTPVELLLSSGEFHPLDQPWCIATDDFGNVYVAGESSNNVLRVAADGSVNQIIGPEGDGAGHVLERPVGITVAKDATVYVSGYGSHNVFAITPGGQITQLLDASHGILQPAELVLDANGNLFVGCMGSNNVVRRAPDGSVTQVLGPTGDGKGNVVKRVMGLALDRNGNLFATGYASHNAFRVDVDGTVTALIDATGDGLGNTFEVAADIVVDGLGNAYVSGFRTHNVFRIAANGDVSLVLGTAGVSTDMPLLAPRGLLLDAVGSLFVAGFASHNLFKIPSTGTAQCIATSIGSGEGQPMYGPWGLALDADGDLLVACYVSDNAFAIKGVGVPAIAPIAQAPSAPTAGETITLVGGPAPIPGLTKPVSSSSILQFTGDQMSPSEQASVLETLSDVVDADVLAKLGHSVSALKEYLKLYGRTSNFGVSSESANSILETALHGYESTGSLTAFAEADFDLAAANFGVDKNVFPREHFKDLKSMIELWRDGQMLNIDGWHESMRDEGFWNAAAREGADGMLKQGFAKQHGVSGHALLKGLSTTELLKFWAAASKTDYEFTNVSDLFDAALLAGGTKRFLAKHTSGSGGGQQPGAASGTAGGSPLAPDVDGGVPGDQGDGDLGGRQGQPGDEADGDIDPEVGVPSDGTQDPGSGDAQGDGSSEGGAAPVGDDAGGVPGGSSEGDSHVNGAHAVVVSAGGGEGTYAITIKLFNAGDKSGVYVTVFSKSESGVWSATTFKGGLLGTVVGEGNHSPPQAKPGDIGVLDESGEHVLAVGEGSSAGTEVPSDWQASLQTWLAVQKYMIWTFGHLHGFRQAYYHGRLGAQAGAHNTTPVPDDASATTLALNIYGDGKKLIELHEGPTLLPPAPPVIDFNTWDIDPPDIDDTPSDQPIPPPPSPTKTGGTKVLGGG